MSKRINWRLVKRHRSYRVDETARLLLVSKGTVLRWIKNGLEIVGPEKPYLITGNDLIDFLKAKSKKGLKLALNECRCFTCLKPRKPAFGEVEISVSNAKSGMMRALCVDCAGLMFKRVSKTQINELKTSVRVTIKQADEHIKDNA